MERDYLLPINESLISTIGNEVKEKPKGKPICNIYVYPNDEGEKPHFHFILNDGTEGCIRLDKEEYFIHGHHTGTMNNEQLKILNHWMGLNSNKNSEMTNWEFCKFIWNQNVNRPKVLRNNKPDYTKLNR